MTTTNGDLGYNGFPVSVNYFTAVPDLSCISDANMAITFKSLLKKDSITKEKSLTDLLARISEHGDGVLEDELLVISWIQLYPKLAIDNSRNVRVLSHQIQRQFLEVIGGKNFSKYLKSSIPIWLAGLFDNDRTVCNVTANTLLDSFHLDQQKVNEKIWIIFKEQILNYINTVVLLETHESLSDQRYIKESDSHSKYERVLNGAIMMLMKLIQLTNTTAADTLLHDNEFLTQLEHIVASDQIWDYLGKSVHPDTSNLTLFKSYLVLIKTLFQLSPNGDANNAISHFKESKSVYKVVSKKFVKNVKLKPSNKSSTGGIIYSNIILQFWDTINTLTRFSQASNISALKIKKNFWELGGSKSHSRLVEYLKLGNCQSSPLYYSVLKSFFTTLSTLQMKPSEDDDEGFLDFHNKKDASSILKIFISQLKTLVNFEFKYQAISCVLHVYSLFYDRITSKPDLEKITTNLAFTLIDTLSYKTPRKTDNDYRNDSISLAAKHLFDDQQLTSSICDHLNSALISKATTDSLDASPFAINDFEFKNSPTNISYTYLDILGSISDSHNRAESSSKLIQDLIGAVLEKSELTNPTVAFKILIHYVNHQFDLTDDLRNDLEDFVALLPSFITPEFVELPLELFASIVTWNKVNINLDELMSDIFTKLTSDSKDHLADFILLLEEKQIADVQNIDYICQYIQSLSEKGDLSESEFALIYKFTEDSSIFANLVQSVSSDPTRTRTFIKYFIKDSGSISIEETDSKTQSSLKQIFYSIWSNLAQPDHKKFAEMGQAPGTMHLLVESLLDFIVNSSAKTDFTHIVEFLQQNSEVFPLKNIEKLVLSAIEHIDKDLLSIANPLAQNICLISNDVKPAKLDYSLISVGRFLDSFLNDDESIELSHDKSDLIILAGIVGEYLSDINFLSNESLIKEDITTTAHSLNRHFANSLADIDLATVCSALNSPESENVSSLSLTILAKINNSISTKDNFTIYQFYLARLFKIVVDTYSNDLSTQNFENLEINYNKLISFPLKSSAWFSSISRFASQSKQLDRTRNFVVAEILGVRSEGDILTHGLKWLTITINFLSKDSDDDEVYDVVPQHRLAMVINQISKWLESDIAYDESFIVMRTQIARFATGLLSFNLESLPDKFWDLSVGLLQDNLSTSQIESTHLELRYATLKLLIGLNKVCASRDVLVWEEAKSSVLNELLDLATNEEIRNSDFQLNNQPVALNTNLLSRIFASTTFSMSALKEKSDQLYDLLINSKYVPIQRIGANYLQQLILETQQEFVVEYQLAKSNLGNDDSENNVYKAQFPKVLIDNIQVPEKDLEDLIVDGASSEVFRYLWSWLLIFAHFKDITYSIRNEYLSQLKSLGVIDKLFDTIFQQVDVNNSQTLKLFTISRQGKNNTKIESSDNLIQSYSIMEGYTGEGLTEEMQFLLIHLFYLSFQHLGSYVQAWFNGIRDRTLKQRIEKFAVNYVSPLIITKILKEVSDNKDKLKNKEEHMDIKVNMVTNEIKSVYLIDEQTMEMVIKVPTSYPMADVAVEGPLRLGVKESRWKAWLLASQKIITLTNGSIIEAIELFNKNVNLNFSGFEDCAICYSILHQDHSLPSKTCPTCSNKFHAACLYKWFKSSGASTCPLCRSPFNFRGSRSTTTA